MFRRFTRCAIPISLGMFGSRFTQMIDDQSSSKSFPTTQSLVALDMDGTLLGKNHELTSTSVNTLRRLSEKGVIICLATGRSGPSLYRFVKQLDLPHPLPAVCYNGASCRIFPPHSTNPKDEQTVLFETPLSEDAVVSVLELAKKLNCLAQYYVGDEIFVVCKSTEDENFVKRYQALTGVKQHSYLDTYDDIMKLKGMPSKILLMTENLNHVVDEAKKIQKHLKNKKTDNGGKSNSFHVISGTPPFFVEFLDSNTQKGNGLMKLCSKLNLNMDKVVSFGDGDNDIEMLKMSGCGVVMLNAKHNIKDHADIITSFPNTENGVSDTLEKMDREGRLVSANSNGRLRQLCSVN